MGLFQKKPQTSSSAPIYTLGLHKTVLVVGLGNLGKKYENTRHNVGFLGVETFVSSHEFSPWIAKKDLKCLMSSGNIGSTRVIVIKPTTFMNLSGEAVQATANFYKIPPAKMVVVHDELDLAFGQIRMRVGGSSAGHNGVLSTIDHIGEDFGRVRIGIGSQQAQAKGEADFVLARFTPKEQLQLPHLTKEVVSLLTEYLASGHLSHDTRTFII